jgi:hypothetical protein
VIGEKVMETRSWHTSHTGKLYIHASKGFPAEAKALCDIEPFKSALAKHGFKRWEDLPTGAIVGSALLRNCRGTSEIDLFDRIGQDRRQQERAFGDYSKGRFAWRLEGAGMLPYPVPCKGALSIWAVPDNVAEMLNPKEGDD